MKSDNMVKAKSAFAVLNAARSTLTLALWPLPTPTPCLRLTTRSLAGSAHAMDTDAQPAAQQSGDSAWVSGQTASASFTPQDGAPEATAAVTAAAGSQKPKRLKGMRLGLAMPQGRRVGIDKRGNRTKAQKKRKAASLRKALAVVDRKATKNGNKAAGASRRNAAKTLWSSGSANMYENLAAAGEA